MSVTRRPSFYLWMALAMCATTIYGFSQTYFSRVLGDSSSDLPTIVHLHGLTFFLWYLLLPLQAGLIHFRNISLHRTLGLASIALATLMSATGFIVVTVRIFQANNPETGPFWLLFGPVILTTLVLFLIFYSLALKNRRNPEIHKRLIVIAGAAGIGAAAFRALASVVGFHLWVPGAGIVLSNIFIVAAIVRDKKVEGKVHRIYWIGLGVCLGAEAIGFVLPQTDAGQGFGQLLVAIGARLNFLYG